jgi:hypothetical protein
MNTSATFSGIVVRRKRAVTSTVTLPGMLVMGGGDIVPSRYYGTLNPPFSRRYQWEAIQPYSQIPGDELAAMEEFETIQNFVRKIVMGSKDLDPRYDQLISDHFWELV